MVFGRPTCLVLPAHRSTLRPFNERRPHLRFIPGGPMGSVPYLQLPDDRSVTYLMSPIRGARFTCMDVIAGCVHSPPAPSNSKWQASVTTTLLLYIHVYVLYVICLWQKMESNTLIYFTSGNLRSTVTIGRTCYMTNNTNNSNMSAVSLL